MTLLFPDAVLKPRKRRELSCVYFFRKDMNHQEIVWNAYMEPETSIDKWLFQLDDDEPNLLTIEDGCLVKHAFI